MAGNKELIIETLKQLGGRVDHAEGHASRIIMDNLSRDVTPNQVAAILRELENDGVVWSIRPSPTARRRNTIALSAMHPEPVSLDRQQQRLIKKGTDFIHSWVGELTEIIEHNTQEWFAEAERYEQQALEKDQQVADLTERLVKSQQRIGELEEELARAQNEVRSVKGSFEAYKRQQKDKKGQRHQPRKKTFADLLAADKRQWSFTNHAKKRMQEMKLTERDVLEVLLDPEVDYVSSYYGEHNRMAQKGDYTVAYDEQQTAVITVLYREVEDWSRDEKAKSR